MGLFALRVAARENLPTQEFRLQYADRQLTDLCLADYHVTPFSTIHLVCRLRGGMSDKPQRTEDFGVSFFDSLNSDSSIPSPLLVTAHHTLKSISLLIILIVIIDEHCDDDHLQLQFIY